MSWSWSGFSTACHAGTCRCSRGDDFTVNVRLSRGLGPNQIHILLDKHDEVWELTVAAIDKPYLFSNICGVLSHSAWTSIAAR